MTTNQDQQQIIRLTLPGTPQQQGSKTRGANGASYEANRNLKAWRADAIHSAQLAYTGAPISGPVAVVATFLYTRPQNHYGTGRNRDKIKKTAPTLKATAPDLDKLQRAVGDALTQAGVLADDRLICRWSAVKAWTAGAPCTAVMVRVVKP